MDALLRRRIMMLAGESPTPPGPEPPTPTVTLTMSSSDIFAGKSIGGYIDVSTNKWKTSTTYYGVIVDITGFEGGTISFSRIEGVTAIRYAYLTAPTFTNNASPSFSSATGYTTQINNTVDTAISETIPTDAHYIYIYTYSSKKQVAPNVTMSASFDSKNVNLEASLFTTNVTIGTDGTVYTGSNAPNTVCSGYLSVHEYAYSQQLQIIVNGYPEGVEEYNIAVCEYTVRQTFIRRNNYDIAPYTIPLSPSCGYLRIIISCRHNGSSLSGDVVRFSGNMLQVKSINTQ